MMDTHEFQINFEAVRKRDQDEVIGLLSQSNIKQEVLQETMLSQSQQLTDSSLRQEASLEALKETMTDIQKAIPSVDALAHPDQLRNLRRNLCELQLETKSLIPDLDLQGGIVQREGKWATEGSSAIVDMWKGTWLLDDRPVVIKVCFEPRMYLISGFELTRRTCTGPSRVLCE
jgi:hypothetical protein